MPNRHFKGLCSTHMNRSFKELGAKEFKAFCSVFARGPLNVAYMAAMKSWGRRQ